MADPVTMACELVGVCVDRSRQRVVHDFAMRAARGTWAGIIGANGSGKTSLLRAIAGRLPIASGSCVIDGEEMAGNRSARAKAIGFAPPIESLPGLLKLSDLLELAGDGITDQHRRNEELWLALGIPAMLDRAIGNLSSGMRQRASIALAFAAPVPIVILDEPFNWLDPVAAFDARAALAGKVREGLSLVTALHDLTTLCSVCDQGVVIANGQPTLELSGNDLRAGAHDIHAFEHAMIEALRT